MYQVSRSMYRELVVLLSSEADSPRGRHDRQQLLRACEGALRRLDRDPHYFARPARYLFNEIRWLFRMSDQIQAWTVVRCHMDVAREVVERAESLRRRRCEAFTRKGTPCKRDPKPGLHFCPSHRHLEPVFGPTASLRPKPVEAVHAAA
jgi:hypothetical protein